MASARVLLLILATTALFSGEAEASRILVMPVPHHSHINLYAKHGEALVRDGHEIWLLTTESFGPLLKGGLVKPIVFPIGKESEFQPIFSELMEKYPTGEGVGDNFFQEMASRGTTVKYCEDLMNNHETMKSIQELHFDLIIMDAISIFSCMYMIPYKFDIPFISIFGFQTSSWLVGVTGMPSVEPEIFTLFSDRMNFWQRLENLQVWMQFVNNEHSITHSQRLMTKYIPADKPRLSFDDILRRSEMFLLNLEVFCLDYPRMSAPNYQYIGGSTPAPAKDLPPDLDSFVHGAEHGVVVMTLGTLEGCQTIWKILKDKLFEAFGRLPQRVIVQYRLPDKNGAPDNVLLLDWLPQNDLLGHPKTTLFITHGGNNGANEAVYHGVPMLVIPVSYDQAYSGERITVHGYGKTVRDKHAVTTDELYGMMNEIINNKTYTDNIKKCSAITRSMPSAQEKLVFWVNHILKFGGAHLRPVSLDMPLYQVLMLDIVAFFLAIGMIMFLGAICLLYLLYIYVRRGMSKVKAE